MKKGILLVNLGTPDSLKVKDLRRYLREFLSDPRVLTIPTLLRQFLLNAIILPTRPRKIQENYKKIWTKEGSPLAVYTRRLAAGVAAGLGKDYIVRHAMRYRLPSMEAELDNMIRQGVTHILVVPLFPQFAMATTGSVHARVFDLMRNRQHTPAINFFGDYYDKAFFIDAQAEVAKPYFADPYDHVVFTYHGLPKDHLTKYSDSGQTGCLKKKNCCAEITPTNSYCYRAQCHATSFALAKKLGIPKEKMTVCFQSRFGPAEWIQPYTTDVLKALGRKKKRIVVMCPAFTADCVETLEEIDEEERENFMDNGGVSFKRIPCVNDSPMWIKGMTEEIAKVF